VEKRILEAAKLGFTRMLVPAGNLKGMKVDSEIEILGVNDLPSAISLALP